MALGVVTFSITAFSIALLGIRPHDAYAECHFGDFCLYRMGQLITPMLTVISMDVVMPSVVASRPGAYTKTFFYSELILYHGR